MAYAALLSLEQTIAHILNHDSYSISPHQKQQIISMNKNVTLLKEFLEGSSEKANNILEGQMRDLANEVENIMEYFMWRRIRYRHINWITKAKFKSELNKVAVQVETMAAKVSDRIKEVWLDDDDYSAAAAATSSSRLAPSYKHDVMVGFEGDLLAIKERLCGDQSSKLQVIPIVGMGGIGKTTLATNAYLDPLIIEHFDIRAWVTVSQDYSAQRIVSDLLCSVKEFNTERTGLSDEEKVYKSLKGTRYLIVIDDIWSREAWDDVRRIFPNDNNGSRVIITTRLLDVASYADSSSPLHEMHLMDKDQSWNLLRQKVFNQETCPLELEKIGKMIAHSCKGLPLGIVVIGGLLSTASKTRALWEEIAENVESAINTTKDGQIEKILSLSYTHLPHHLRPCFLYMAAFPEDYGIRVSKIIKLWISEGFIKPSISRSFEEEAEEYFEDLVKRSLVMVSKRKSNGKIKSCRLHDVMRELCIEKAQQDKFLQHVMDREVHSKRRICIIQSDRNHSSSFAKTKGESNFNCLANIYGLGIHTIICFRDSEWSSWNLQYFRFLRVLDLEFSNFDFSVSSRGIQLPDEVFELFHLRYLAFGYTMHVPSAISNLKNLQTLIMHPRKIKPWFESSKLWLSSEIWNMPELRHLVSHYLCLLRKPEEGARSHVLEFLSRMLILHFQGC